MIFPSLRMRPEGISHTFLVLLESSVNKRSKIINESHVSKCN
jgi:hypothetical protein